MAKHKLYYYECVLECDVGYIAPDHRKERWPEGTMQPPMIVHSWRFKAAKNPQGTGDVLIVDRPLASMYTDEVSKTVKRKNMRTGEYSDVPTHSKIKFRLLETEEIGDMVRKKGRHLVLQERDYAVGGANAV
jgi:hypothetical protein